MKTIPVAVAVPAEEVDSTVVLAVGHNAVRHHR
jgi:hypothetical protein